MNLNGFGCQGQIMANGQAGCPLHAMLSDPRLNDPMSIAYDRTKDGIPDYLFLHPITWS